MASKPAPENNTLNSPTMAPKPIPANNGLKPKVHNASPTKEKMDDKAWDALRNTLVGPTGIPKHCRERSFITSTSYLVRDVVYCYLFYLAYQTFVPETYSGDAEALEKTIWWAAQIFYAFGQGTLLMGLWVIGHECGHHAYCEYNAVSDVVGFLLHIPLMVPYFAWQYSHKRHHARTNHLMEGETYVPPSSKGKRTKSWLYKLGAEGGPTGEAIFGLTAMGTLLLGWPLYIIKGAAGGRRNAAGKRMNSHSHFYYSDIFEGSGVPRWKIELSAVACIGWQLVMFYWGITQGFGKVCRLYYGPQIVVNMWLVGYTYLHHADEENKQKLPQYGDGEDGWKWVKGALGTIDRDYGIFDHFHHHIGSTHVAHHLCSSMPHYHAEEVTRRIKKILGDRYVYSDENFLVALFRTAKGCAYVEGLTGTQVYRPVTALRH